jgi:hypothetical protein
MMQISEISEEEFEQLSSVILNNTIRWHKVLRRAFKIQIKYLGVFSDSGLEAALPIMSMKKFIFNLSGCPLRGTHTDVAGIIKNSEKAHEILQAVRLWARGNGVDWLEMALPIDLGNSSLKLTNLSSDYKIEEDRTILLDLKRSEDSVWTKMQGRARNEIRKAAKYEITIDALNADFNNSHMDMVRKTFERQKRSPSFSVEFLNSIYDELYNDDYLHLGAFHHNKLVATGLFTIDARRMFFVSGASTPEGRKTGANSLLQWKAIETALGRKVYEYDMGGAGIDRIDKFKLSFGGECVGKQRVVWRRFYMDLPAHIYKIARLNGWLS